MGGEPSTYRGVLFDLFGTLVFFSRATAPTAWTAAAAHSQLQEAVRRELPRVPLETFVERIREVTREIMQARRETHAECSSPERFRRVLLRLGIDDVAMAERLCLAHMSGLAAAAEMPPEHLTLLRSLAGRVRLGLVSNFDHAPTARGILRRCGLEELLDPIVISDDFGWRKPRGDIFQHAVEALGVPASDVVFVGDTPLDDIDGARRAGLDAAWINPRNDPYPDDLLPPVHVLRELADLNRILGPLERGAD